MKLVYACSLLCFTCHVKMFQNILKVKHGTENNSTKNGSIWFAELDKICTCLRHYKVAFFHTRKQPIITGKTAFR